MLQLVRFSGGMLQPHEDELLAQFVSIARAPIIAMLERDRCGTHL